METSEGGYALAGDTSSFGAGDMDFWLVKTDSDGNEQWNQTYGGADLDSANSMIQTGDGGYAIAGHTSSFGGGGPDFWLVKTDSNGNMHWNQTYGGTNYDFAYSVVQTGDGGYAIAGHTESFGVGAYDLWLVKTDSDGNEEWNQTYGGTDSDSAYSMVQTSSGGYAIAGSTNSFGAGDMDFWLVKTDSNGKPSFTDWMTDWFLYGLAWTDSTNNTISLYRGKTDFYWNYVRVRIWTIKEPTWQYGDIDMDGDVDYDDFIILAGNYGKTYSALSLGGIAAVAGIYIYKKRKQPK